MADLDQVRTWAEALIARHLDPLVWTFGFDRAMTRAGLCSFSAHRISVSRHLASRHGDDEIHQTLLHEIAHALAGPRAGHGAKWRTIAKGIGCDGKRTHDGAIAVELAPWVGSCPAGHVHYRYRRPKRLLACGRCSRHFSREHAITWQARAVTPAVRDRAARSTPGFQSSS